MPPTTAPAARPENRLLARLPKADFRRLFPRALPVPFAFRQQLCQARSPVEYAYFPYSGCLSAITIMDDGRAIEVATIGNEGMVGLGGVFESGSSPNDVIIQVAGEGLRVDIAMLKAETERDGPVRDLMSRYHSAYQTQVSFSVACNGLHTIQQRCCRWVLITHDRVGSNTVPLTHEFLAIMLGVRRPSVTEVLHPLQGKGLIQNGRGAIRILDRQGLEALACECYRRTREEYDRLLGPPPS
jgi:CRP-like cAMP-binding protein